MCYFVSWGVCIRMAFGASRSIASGPQCAADSRMEGHSSTHPRRRRHYKVRRAFNNVRFCHRVEPRAFTGPRRTVRETQKSGDWVRTIGRRRTVGIRAGED